MTSQILNEKKTETIEEKRIGDPTMNHFGSFLKAEGLIKGVNGITHPVSDGIITPRGGIITAAGGSSSCRMIAALGTLLTQPIKKAENVFLLSLEGGLLIVRPKGGRTLTKDELYTHVDFTEVKVGGPISSEQEIVCGLADGKKIEFERTIIDPHELSLAIKNFGGRVRDFRIVGPPEGSNFVISLDGKVERKFMSGFYAVPTELRPKKPFFTMSIDQFGRLSPELTTTSGYIQQFVEISWPMPKPPTDPKWGPHNPCYIQK